MVRKCLAMLLKFFQEKVDFLLMISCHECPMVGVIRANSEKVGSTGILPVPGRAGSPSYRSQLWLGEKKTHAK